MLSLVKKSLLVTCFSVFLLPSQLFAQSNMTPTKSGSSSSASSILGNGGMYVGVSGDVGLYLNSYKSTLQGRTTDATPEASKSIMDVEFDKGFNGSAYFGFLSDSGLTADLELGGGMTELKDKTKNNHDMKNYQIKGLVNIGAMVPVGSMLHLGASVGLGLVRNAIEGNFASEKDGNAPGKASFSDIISYDLAYQARAMVAVSVSEDALVGVAYKFFGSTDIKNIKSNDYKDLKSTYKAGDKTYSNELNIDKLSFNAHYIEAFVKFMV